MRRDEMMRLLREMRVDLKSWLNFPADRWKWAMDPVAKSREDGALERILMMFRNLRNALTTVELCKYTGLTRS